MNFDWTEKQTEMKNGVAGILDKAALLNIEQMETQSADAIRTQLLGFSKSLAAIDYLSLAVGPDSSDAAMDLLAGQEELAAATGPVFLALEYSARLFGGLVAGYGNDAQKSAFLAMATNGEHLCAAVISPGDEFEAAATDDGFTVSGNWSYVTNGPIADCIALRGDIDGRPTFFLVNAKTTGVTIGDRHETLGYKGLVSSGVSLSKASIPAANVIGPFADDKPMQFLKTQEALMLASAATGLTRKVQFATTDFAKTHTKNGKPLFYQQVVGYKCAEILAMQQTSEFYCRRAAWMISRKDLEAPTVVQCAKVFCAETAEDMAADALQIWGGEGFVGKNPIEQSYRDAKFASVAGASNDFGRLQIAQDLLTKHQV
jgi:alkylation response protein AidB-like acyl-CoA dehydrogenase